MLDRHFVVACTMHTVVSAFADRGQARHAAERLSAQGFPSPAVRVHETPAAATNSAGVTVDEVVTGGLLHNVGGLLDGLFGMTPKAHEADTFADVVRDGGAVVVVEVRDEAAAERVAALLVEAGASKQTTVEQSGQAAAG